MSLILVIPLLLATPWLWPVDQQIIVHDYDPPAHSYGAGHRGIDLPSRVGEPVHAAESGVVSFASMINAVPSISINHGEVRSTYQPVTPVVAIGDRVSRGDVIGFVVRVGNHCHAVSCVHIGVKRGDDYLDPHQFFSATARVVLISPDGPPPLPHGAMPVAGPITSPMAWRTHPITGKRHFHDGIDIAAPCGTTVRSVDFGKVSFVGRKGGYGNRVEVTTDVGITSYSHLKTFAVRIGEQVHAQSRIGTVGSTGTATGCHVHFTPSKK